VSVTPIRLLGDPVLRTPAAPVVDFDQELRRLVADLTDTMFAAGGAGLAAPQIGVGLRVFTWYVDGEVGHLVNPGGDAGGGGDRGGPGGLPVHPRLHLRLPPAPVRGRHRRRPARRAGPVEGSHLLARAVQHEVDHLDGVLFVDRLDAEARAAALAAIGAAEWAGAGAWVPRVEVSPH
jgi:peptide deformylase